MRILFLSNIYPPASGGGYSQLCHEAATGLQARGHTVGVLTSRYEQDRVTSREADIFRVLHLDGALDYYRPLHFFGRWRQQQAENQENARAVLERFAPDLVVVWGMWSMSHAVPALAEALMPGRVVYFISDYWPASVDMHTAYWRLPPQRWFMRPVKGLLGAAARQMLASDGQHALRFTHAICNSASVRDVLLEAGVAVGHARIIHGGTDPAQFHDDRERDFCHRPLKLLYAGQMVPHKGVHTALEAVARLTEWGCGDCLSLALVGSGHPDYEASLRDTVRRGGLQRVVEFRGAVPREQMPRIVRQADVLIFPSIYEEPFARMPQEAMLAGLVVVATMTGGTKELLEEGQTALTFAPEDAEGLARQIARLLQDPALCQRLSQTGRQTVLENHTLDGMLDKLENYLLEVVQTPA